MIFGTIDEKQIPAPWVIKRVGGIPYLEFNYGRVCITIEKRPSYCDRGNWIAKITEPGDIYIDVHDGWPRYYFELRVAFSEITAFLMKHEELIPKKT